MRLKPTRIEDVPVPELSGLALSGTRLVAIGDRKAVLAHAVLADEHLEWSVVDLDPYGLDRAQFEGIAMAADGTILVLREHPPIVHVLDLDGDRADTITLLAGDGVLDDVFADSSASCEGLVPLGDRRLLVAKEKRPPLLVEFGPTDAAGSLRAIAAWRLDDVEDISDLSIAGGELYCLSDTSRRIVVVTLPLDRADERARPKDTWDLEVPERDDEPDGKPEGLVVTEDDALIVGLDTERPVANLCWYRRP